MAISAVCSCSITAINTVNAFLIKQEGLEVSAYSISPDGQYLLLPYDYYTQLQDTQGKARYKMYDLEADEEIDFPNSEEPGMQGGIMDYCGWGGSAGSSLVRQIKIWIHLINIF